jgi:transglutaminase-like putative cysteine protease
MDQRRIQQRCRHGEFFKLTARLTIESLAVVELAAGPWPVFDIAASALRFPFDYSDEERTDLGALAQPHYPDPPARLADWTCGFVRGQVTDTLALLKDLGAGVATEIFYRRRDEEGTQSPVQTLGRGWRSCRDIAVLFAEAARTLGFGARLISATCTIPIARLLPPAPREARRMAGRRFSCPAPAGSRLIRPTARSAAIISFPSRSAASSTR